MTINFNISSQNFLLRACICEINMEKFVSFSAKALSEAKVPEKPRKSFKMII